MAEALRQAQFYARGLKYAGDNLPTQAHSSAISARVRLSSHAIQISNSVTPLLAERLSNSLKRLRLPYDAVDAFIYSSPDVQAECFSDGPDRCVISFASGLVDLLDEDEFEFVAGHEIGHFLLGHDPGRMSDQKKLALLVGMRAQEISADRLGLVACGSLDVAIRALMKTISGLSSRHLRFDVATFISQLRSLGGATDVAGMHSTHPSMLVRCRALLWFALTGSIGEPLTVSNKKSLQALDRRIDSDFHKYVDGPARKRLEAAKNEYAMWTAVAAALKDGSLDKKDQGFIRENFGEEILVKLKSLLTENSSADAMELIDSNLSSARQQLLVMFPNSGEDEIEQANARIARLFS